MNSIKKRNLIGQLLLLYSVIAWGSSFTILKDAMDTLPGFFIIGVRFTIAGLVFGLIFIKKIIKMDKKTLVNGLILGLLVALAYFTQTWGLKYTTPSKNAFLTATYCVLCPFIAWLVFKKKPKIYNVISAVLCIVGTGLILLSGNKEEGGSLQLLGDGLTIVCAVFFSLQILFIDRFNERKSEPIALLTVHFFVIGFFMLIMSAIFELPQVGIEGYKMNGEQLWKVAYLTFACSIGAQTSQYFGQRLMGPTGQAAIIQSLESVFGVIFAVILGAEKLTVTLIIGFVIVFIAMLISELHLDPMKFFKRKSKQVFGEGEVPASVNAPADDTPKVND